MLPAARADYHRTTQPAAAGGVPVPLFASVQGRRSIALIRRGAPLLVALGALAVASCGGGGTSAPPFFTGTAAPGTPTPSPSPTASPTPAPGSTTAAIPSGGGPVALPTVAGEAATLTFAAGAPAGTTLTATESTTAPGGAPAPSSLRRASSFPGATPFFFVKFTVSANVSLATFAGEAVSLLSSQPQTASYYAELDDMTTASATVVLSRCGPATPSTFTATIVNSTCLTSGVTSLSTGHSYLLQFYYVAAGTPTPTPSATPTMTPTATPKPTATPVPTATPTPTITEYSVPPGSQPNGITAGPDGNLWFLDNAATSYAGKLTTGGNATPFAQPSGFALSGITLGGDGNLYFGASGPRSPAQSYVGQITTGGVTTEFAIPNGPVVVSIASGPDGALWFTAVVSGSNVEIGRVTTTGDFSAGPYAIPSATSLAPAVGITAGHDGALWFTEESANKIGRISTSGTITEYTHLAAGANPEGITAGPDGALWFTESGTNKIGRITTGGTVTEYAIPTANSAPFGITAGADGALWFTENAGNKIGRITTAGTVTTELAVPTAGSLPGAITVGPDRNIWFSEVGSDKIGTVR
jgi:virginiamycin B lyase